MSATGAGYDYSVSTFSPNGRVFQVEYASKAVEKSGTAIGIRCIDGVVLGVEKSILSKMIVPGSNRRIHTIDLHSGLAMSGLAADARQLVNKARTESSEYQAFYGSSIPGKVLSDRLAGFVHTYTLYWYLRPFGCSVLLATYDSELSTGPQLYCIEPSGVSYRYFACAIGKSKQGASAELEKLKFDTLTCRDAVKIITNIIYKNHDEVKDKELELELSWVCDESKRKHVYVPEALKVEAFKLAKEAKTREEMEDSDDEQDTASTSAPSAAAAAAAAASPPS